MARCHVRYITVAFALVAASLSSVAVAQERRESSPTEQEFKDRAKQLEPNNAIATRLEAAKWLDRHSGAKNAHLAVPVLDRCIREDREARVRDAAVISLARIALKRGDPCPLIIVETILDKDEFVSQTAGLMAGQFMSFAPGCVDVLLRSDNSKLGGGNLTTLARAGGAKDKRVLEAIEKAMRHKSFGVRHNAHAAMFQATGNFAEFLKYLIGLQEGTYGVKIVDGDTKERQRDESARGLARLSSAMLIVEWSEKRPDDLADVLVKLLADPSPDMRRGAARLIGAAAIKVDLAQKPRETQNEQLKVQKPPQRSKAASPLEKLNAEERLRELRDNDPHNSVRDAARVALECLASVRQAPPRP